MLKFLLLPPMTLLLILISAAACSQNPQGELVGTNIVVLTNTTLRTNTTLLTNQIQSLIYTQTNVLKVSNNVTNYFTATNTNSLTNSINLTNYLTDTYTNDAQTAVNLSDFSNYMGDWMVTAQTYQAIVDTTNGDGTVTETTAVLTNNSFCLSNGGTNGTIVYRFNPDSSVDMFVYDSNGNVMTSNLDYRTFSVYSNTTLSAGDPDRLYVELVDPTTVSETVYWTPEGTTVITLATNTYVTSNYVYGATNVSNITEVDPFQVTVTNYWEKHDQISRTVESYIYSLAFGSTTNLSWTPNSISNQSPQRWSSAARKKSEGQVNTTTTVANGNGDGSVSTITTFEQEPWSTWQMVKITNH
jgi:hypothetical protein